MIALFCVPQVAMSQEFETNADGGLHHIPGKLIHSTMLSVLF